MANSVYVPCIEEQVAFETVMPGALIDPVTHLTDQTTSQGFHASLAAHLCHSQTITASPSDPGKQQGPVKCLVQGEGLVLSRAGCFSPYLGRNTIHLDCPFLAGASKQVDAHRGWVPATRRSACCCFPAPPLLPLEREAKVRGALLYPCMARNSWHYQEVSRNSDIFQNSLHSGTSFLQMCYFFLDASQTNF